MSGEHTHTFLPEEKPLVGDITIHADGATITIEARKDGLSLYIGPTYMEERELTNISDDTALLLCAALKTMVRERKEAARGN